MVKGDVILKWKNSCSENGNDNDNNYNDDNDDNNNNIYSLNMLLLKGYFLRCVWYLYLLLYKNQTYLTLIEGRPGYK